MNLYTLFSNVQNRIETRLKRGRLGVGMGTAVLNFARGLGHSCDTGTGVALRAGVCPSVNVIGKLCSVCRH